MLSLLIANDIFLMRIVVGGSVPGQQGGSDPSKGGNGGWKFFRVGDQGVDAGRDGLYSESQRRMRAYRFAVRLSDQKTRRAGGVLWRVPPPGCGSPPGAYCRWY
jgi:hypothetical protein